MYAHIPFWKSTVNNIGEGPDLWCSRNDGEVMVGWHMCVMWQPQAWILSRQSFRARGHIVTMCAEFCTARSEQAFGCCPKTRNRSRMCSLHLSKRDQNLKPRKKQERMSHKERERGLPRPLEDPRKPIWSNKRETGTHEASVLLLTLSCPATLCLACFLCCSAGFSP